MKHLQENESKINKQMKENGPLEGHKRIDLTLGTAEKLDNVIVVTSPHAAKGSRD